MRTWLLWSVLGLWPACVGGDVVVCGELVCPQGSVCLADRCVAAPQLEVCRGQAEGATCSLGGDLAGTCIEGVCTFEQCGDGVTSGNEVCDDGVASDGEPAAGDGCAADCLSDETCGNGVRDASEACDDGNVVDGDGCQGGCTRPACGDGVLDDDERCDDGNTVDGDGCAGDCRSDETCGNGVRDVDEECDDADNDSGDGCQADCRFPVCGDQVVDDGEVCDDGVGSGGGPVSGDGCAADCRSDEICGNGIQDVWEDLDPGPGVDTGEACDDGVGPGGVPVGGDGCRADCTRELCGDGTQDPGEICDPAVPGSICAPDCSSDLSCGNQTVDALAGEACDDGNARSHDGCDPSCQLESPTLTPRWPGSAALPGHRDAAMAYDATREVMVLFGGELVDEAGGGLFRGTWEWTGDAWFERTGSPQPPDRTNAAMAYDAARREIVMFGGFAPAEGGYSNATWIWNGTRWKDVTPLVGSPSPRGKAAMAYDSARREVVMYGGVDDVDGPPSTTYAWDGTAWHARGPGPALFDGDVSMAYDPRRDRTVMYVSSMLSPSGVYEWDGQAWGNRVVTAPAPGERAGAAMAFDARLGEVQIVGGLRFENQGGPFTLRYLGDTWSWNGTRWQLRSAGGLPEVSDHALAYDVVREELVAIGSSAPVSAESTWRLGSAAAAWTSAATPTPALVYGLAHAAIPDTGEVFVVGAQDTQFLTFRRFSARWNGQRWSTVSLPSARVDAQMAYDSVREELVLFSGRVTEFMVDCGIESFGAGSPPVTDQQTWVWTGSQWLQRVPVSSPPGRMQAVFAEDRRTPGRLLLHGGSDGCAALGDTWLWDGVDWTPVLTPTAMVGRADAALGYDPRRGELVLHGGADGAALRNDTWAWTGNDWAAFAVADPPAPRQGASLVFDGDRGRLRLIGGSVFADLARDAFEWDGDSATWTPGGAPTPLSRGPTTFLEAPWNGGLLGVNDKLDVWSLRFLGDDAPEVCTRRGDLDGDGLDACADSDCWGRCTPACAPPVADLGACVTDPAPRRCGDGVGEFPETCRSCPEDFAANPCPIVCGDYLCDPGETGCPGDCPP